MAAVIYTFDFKARKLVEGEGSNFEPVQEGSGIYNDLSRNGSLQII